jgi:hypothetical protein
MIAAITLPSPPFFLGGGGLRRLSISLMVQNAGVIHSRNIFDHSKHFLAFFTSSTLLMFLGLYVNLELATYNF